MSSAVCETREGWGASAKASGACGRARRGFAGGSGEDRREGPSDVAGLGDPVQRAGAWRSHQHPFAGAPPKLDDTHKAFLRRPVEEGPISAIHGVVRWRAGDLIMRLHDEFGLSVPDDTIYRALKELGFPHVTRDTKGYKQDAEAIEAFKKTSRYAWRNPRETPPGTPVEVRSQDDMRVGQKNKLTYRWARKGSRPWAIHDQRTQSTYLFGAVCPKRGAGAALGCRLQHRGHAAPSRRIRNESPRRT